MKRRWVVEGVYESRALAKAAAREVRGFRPDVRARVRKAKGGGWMVQLAVALLLAGCRAVPA